MSLRAVVVDASLTIRMDIGDALEAAGVEALPCADLRAARQAVEGGPPSVVLLDIHMPDGDALAFLRDLKTPGSAGVPVVLLASREEVAGQERGFGVVADAYFPKPYDLGKLVECVADLADRRPGGRGETDRRVLVIDDSATYRNELRAALEGAGYSVQEARTGEDGLAAVAALRPHAIVVDGVLPGIDGATVVRRLKADAALRSTPCLLLTAAEGDEDELKSLEAGADAFVRKSEDGAVILARISALLRTAGGGAEDEGLPSLLAPKRLLAVDDSVTYLRALGERLRREGYEVLTAGSGEEALELLSTHPVDGILLDLVMPGLSGHETCRRVKQAPEWRDIPLVMLTAREDREAMIEGINAGADDYIAKSADFGVLTARLRAQLRRKHFEDENRRIRDRLVRREAEASYTRALEGTNRELARAKEQAEQSSRSKSSFLANMSHELRTPLNAIIGFAELLYDGQVAPDSPEHREFLGDILSSGRHLLQLINDILDLSKVEAGRLEFHPEPVDLPALLAEVLAVLRALASSKGVRITTEIDRELNGLVLDPSRLKQVVYNYVSNALKFTPDGGQIWIRARPQGDAAFVLEVEDFGVGIAPQDLDRLFTEFEQLDAGVAKRHAGTGLGLALTKRLVEAQGGTVGVRSTLGSGSTFYAALPRRGGNHGR